MKLLNINVKYVKTYSVLLFVSIIVVISIFLGCMCEKQNSLLQSSNGMLNENILYAIRFAIDKKCVYLNDEEKEAIQSSTPKIGKYVMADAFGQFFWSWDLPTGKNIDVSFIGDIAKPIDEEKLSVKCYCIKYE